MCSFHMLVPTKRRPARSPIGCASTASRCGGTTDTARTALTLVQATLDGTIPPMPFNQIQCADLTALDDQADSPGWRKLMGSVSALAGAPAPAAETRRAPAKGAVSVCVLPFQNMS